MVAAAAAARQEATNPRQIAQALVDRLPASDMLGPVEIAGPGFLNIPLSDHWLQQQVTAIVAAGAYLRQ